MPTHETTGVVRRLSTETKQSVKTSEFFAYLVVFAGILIAATMIGGEGEEGDWFRADEAWRYITALTIGYMVSRGLAKAGSRDPYWDNDDGNSGTNRH